jgi:hypothetical protein
MFTSWPLPVVRTLVSITRSMMRRELGDGFLVYAMISFLLSSEKMKRCDLATIGDNFPLC